MSADQQQRRGSDHVFGVARNRDDDEQSIIDVFEFDDTDQDRWLYTLGNKSRRNSVEADKIEDLEAWLHADVSDSEAVQIDSNSKRSIDSRTFTRIKRRSNKLNFDGVEGSTSTENLSFSLSNVWKNKSIPESNEQIFNNNNNDKDQSIQNDKRDSGVPMMLRPKSNQILAALLSESPSSINSQTSMEAFMNIARKEGNNFLLSDVSDPDLSSVLMNISQPSLLYSSIISDSKNDDNVQQQSMLNNIENGMIDSQILTDSMMEASMFKEVQDTTVLAQFLKQNNDITIIENTSFNLNDKTFVNDNLNDRTYTNTSDNELGSCNTPFVAVKNLKPNETYNTVISPVQKVKSANSTRIISPLLNTTRTVIMTPNSLNSTQVLSSEADLLQNDVLSTTQTQNTDQKIDLTFEVKPQTAVEERMNTTYQTSSDQLLQLSGSSGSSTPPLDATFNIIPPLRAELLNEVRKSSSGSKLNGTFTNSPKKLDVTYDRPSSAESLIEIESLDATYVYVPSEHRSKSPTNKLSLDVTYDTMTLTSKLSNPTNSISTQHQSYVPSKNPTESQSHSSDPNRFNTFRKESKISSRLSKAVQMQENHTPPLPLPKAHVPNTKGVDNSCQQRCKTFSKKTNVRDHISSKPTTEVKSEEQQSVKPFIRQIQPPRTLSKLPQLFQRSNPNLVTNTKLLHNSRLSINSGIGFKGSQPNINSNMQMLGRFKSERLLPRKKSTEFSTSEGITKSMDSIDSNASAHSSPDLDDKRSVASNSSRGSYTVKPRNLNIMSKLGSVEDKMGLFDGSTPKVKVHQVLQNNWIQEKDLPSPIFKNGISKNHLECDSRSSSPSDSTEFSAKTSSPLTNSPSNSDHTVNTISDSGIEAAKENIKVTENVKPKQQIKAPSTTITTKGTMLRRPSNWTGASNKATNGPLSGIPRPASRIPAPRFAKPNLK